MTHQPTPSHRRAIVATLIVGTFMGALDSSIVNISIPTMMRSLNTGLSEIEWVVTAYIIAFAVVMPLTQWLKDRLGYFRLYFGSLAVFTIGSLFCGLAPNLETLVIARVVQALGGGAMTPTAMAVLASIYEPKERGRVLGLWGLGVVAGPALGPTLGGIMTEYFGWPSIFLINIPVGAIGLTLTWLYLRPLSLVRSAHARFDFAGFASLTIFLVSLLYGISQVERQGLGSPILLLYFLVAIAALVFFVVIEKRQERPLIDLTLFRQRPFVACLLVTFSRTAALYGGIFLLPFLFQDLLHYTETQSGLLMFPGSGLVAVMMPFAGWYADRKGARGISLLGLFLLSCSMVLFSRMGQGTTTPEILLAMVGRGIGLGLLVTPISVAIVNSVPPQEVALASSMSSLIQQIGGAIGVATLAVLHEILKNGAVARGVETTFAEQGAVQACFLAAAGLTFVALLPGMFVPKGAPRSAPPEVRAEAMAD